MVQFKPGNVMTTETANLVRCSTLSQKIGVFAKLFSQDGMIRVEFIVGLKLFQGLEKL